MTLFRSARVLSHRFNSHTSTLVLKQSPTYPLCIDFAKKVKVDIVGLTPEQIEERVKDMVEKGDGMPRSLHQSIEPFSLPAVLE